LTTLRLTGLTDDRPVYSDTDDTLQSITLGTGLAFSAPTLSLSHLGLQSLTDPNANRIFFWDDSEGASKWLACGNSIAITTTTLDTIQDIRTAASPTFAGLTLTAMSGIVKATAGVLAGGGAHADLATVTANQQHNQAHVLDGADHTVSGLTAGHVLKALTTTTFGFAAPAAESDPVFGASAAAGIATGDITDWDEAHGWGDHAAAGYAHDVDLHAIMTLGTANGLSLTGQELSLPVTGSPQFVGLTLTGNLTMPEDGWIGIGAAAEQILFNGSADEIQIDNALLRLTHAGGLICNSVCGTGVGVKLFQTADEATNVGYGQINMTSSGANTILHIGAGYGGTLTGNWVEIGGAGAYNTKAKRVDLWADQIFMNGTLYPQGAVMFTRTGGFFGYPAPRTAKPIPWPDVPFAFAVMWTTATGRY
jgi:hypothetical protein